MPYMNALERTYVNLKNILSGFKLFKYPVVLFRIYEGGAVELFKLYAFIETGESGAKVIKFSNGYYSLLPEGAIQYTIIDGKNGFIFGYDGSNIWNLTINEKEKLLEIAIGIDAEKNINFNNLVNAERRIFNPRKKEQHALFLMVLAGILFVSNVVSSFFLFNAIKDTANVVNTNNELAFKSADEVSKMLKVMVYIESKKNNVDRYELEQFINQTFNYSIKSEPKQEGPRLPSLPTLPS